MLQEMGITRGKETRRQKRHRKAHRPHTHSKNAKFEIKTSWTPFRSTQFIRQLLPAEIKPHHKKSSYKQKSSPAALHFWPGICSHTFIAQFYFCLKTGILQKAYLETVDPGFPRLKIDIEGVLIKLFCLNFWLSNHLDWVKGNNLPAASFSFCTLKMSKIFQHVLLSCGDTESRRNLEVKSLEFQSEKSEN